MLLGNKSFSYSNRQCFCIKFVPNNFCALAASAFQFFSFQKIILRLGNESLYITNDYIFLRKICGLVGNKIINDTEDENFHKYNRYDLLFDGSLIQIKTDPIKLQHRQRMIGSW